MVHLHICPIPRDYQYILASSPLNIATRVTFLMILWRCQMPSGFCFFPGLPNHRPPIVIWRFLGGTPIAGCFIMEWKILLKWMIWGTTLYGNLHIHYLNGGFHWKQWFCTNWMRCVFSKCKFPTVFEILDSATQISCSSCRFAYRIWSPSTSLLQ